MGTVAVIGASRERSKYGNRAVRAYLRQGWTVWGNEAREGWRPGWDTYPHNSGRLAAE